MAASLIEMFYSTDKNGHAKAYRFSRQQMRSFPMSRQAADDAILEGRAVVLDGNPLKPVARRVKYDARHLSSVGPAAQQLAAADGHTRYIVPTYNGYRVETEQPPSFQKHIVVNPDGTHHEA